MRLKWQLVIVGASIVVAVGAVLLILWRTGLVFSTRKASSHDAPRQFGTSVAPRGEVLTTPPDLKPLSNSAPAVEVHLDDDIQARCQRWLANRPLWPAYDAIPPTYTLHFQGPHWRQDVHRMGPLEFGFALAAQQGQLWIGSPGEGTVYNADVALRSPNGLNDMCFGIDLIASDDGTIVIRSATRLWQGHTVLDEGEDLLLLGAQPAGTVWWCRFSQRRLFQRTSDSRSNTTWDDLLVYDLCYHSGCIYLATEEGLRQWTPDVNGVWQETGAWRMDQSIMRVLCFTVGDATWLLLGQPQHDRITLVRAVDPGETIDMLERSLQPGALFGEQMVWWHDRLWVSSPLQDWQGHPQQGILSTFVMMPPGQLVLEHVLTQAGPEYGRSLVATSDALFVGSRGCQVWVVNKEQETNDNDVADG